MNKYKFDTFIFNSIKKNNFDEVKSLMESYPKYALGVDFVNSVIRPYNYQLYELFKHACKHTTDINILKYIYNYSVEHDINLFANKYYMEHADMLLYIFNKNNMETIIWMLEVVPHKDDYFMLICLWFADINIPKYVYNYSLEHGINLFNKNIKYHLYKTYQDLLHYVAIRQNIKLFQWILDIMPNKIDIIDSEFIDKLYIECVDRSIFKIAKYMADHLKPYKYLLVEKNIKGLYFGRIRKIEEQKWYYARYMLWLSSVELSPNKNSFMYKIPNDIIYNIIEWLI